MNAFPRVSTCIDCGCAVIGESPRCFGCHDEHARTIEAQTTPYVRQDPNPNPMPSILTRWLVAAEVAVIFVLGLALVLKECLF